MSQQPAIVLVTSSFPISGDGSEAAGAFVADLAEEMAKHVAVRVVAPGPEDSTEAWATGITVFRYRAPNRPLSTLRTWHPVDAWRVLGVLRSGASATERAMAAGPVAHLFALWALPCGEWARNSARKHGVGYSVWTLGSDIWSLGRIPVVRSRLRTILRGAEHAWSDGLRLAEDTCAIAGREVGFLPSTRRIERVRTEPLRSQPPYRLLFLGRWHPNKGVDLLLDALRQLADQDWAGIQRVTIAGGGPMEGLVRSGVEHLQSNGRFVELRGYLDRRQAEQAMLDADYLLIPSRIESIPVVFSDAVKLGLPVIATPVGDLPRLLNHKSPCGVLASDRTADEFREALHVAVHSAPKMFQQGTTDVAERFGLPTIACELVAKFRVAPVH